MTIARDILNYSRAGLPFTLAVRAAALKHKINKLIGRCV
ncbi:MAG: hypothetical protein K0R43_1735 [Pseudoduganella sp.]|jgi:hypothetical protein|nr:hypothetical protein [Pseudoduganella sp.]